jgi:hypothetical protein
MRSVAGIKESEQGPLHGRSRGCDKCDSLADYCLGAIPRPGRLQRINGALAFGLLKLGRVLLRLGLRRLHPDCPVRQSLESLRPLVDLAMAKRSRKDPEKGHRHLVDRSTQLGVLLTLSTTSCFL